MKKVMITINEELLLVLKNMAIENSTSVSQMIRRLVLEESKRNEEME